MTIQNPTSNAHCSSDSLITRLTALGARAYFRELANTGLDGCMQIYSALTHADTISKDQRDKGFAALSRAKLLIEADEVEMLSALADSGREMAFEMIMAEYEGSICDAPSQEVREEWEEDARSIGELCYPYSNPDD